MDAGSETHADKSADNADAGRGVPATGEPETDSAGAQRAPETATDTAAGGRGGSPVHRDAAGSGGSTEAGGTGGSAERGGSEAPKAAPARSSEPLAPDQTEIPAETADAESLRALADWSHLPVFSADRLREQSVQDRGNSSPSEGQLNAVLAYGNRDINNFLCKSADADINGTAISAAYRYDMNACPESYVRGAELARFEGSGRMVRLWLTSTSFDDTSKVEANEVLRIYVDDNPRPLLQVPIQEMRAGAAHELFAAPFGSGSKVAITWRYPVVFGSKLVVALDRLRADYVFQVDAQLDASQRTRVSAMARLPERDQAHSRLASPSVVPPTAASLRSADVSLEAGQSYAVELTGPSTIDEVSLRVRKDQLARLSHARLSVRWDDADPPAIALPLLAFFAAQRSAASNSSLALSSTIEGDEQVLALRLPMPFKTRASWLIDNQGTEALSFGIAWTGRPELPSEPFGHLYTQWTEPSLPLTQLVQTIARANARGRLVGLCADLAGGADPTIDPTQSSPLLFACGETRANADGVQALNGTGSDDDSDSAFVFLDAPSSTPFAQTWNRVSDRSANPTGQISFCRWRVLGNELDFQNTLTLTHEAAQHDPKTVALYRTVAYLYLQ